MAVAQQIVVTCAALLRHKPTTGRRKKSGLLDGARESSSSGRVEGKDLAVNSSFTHATGDQLSVLSTEVKYDYCFVS